MITVLGASLMVSACATKGETGLAGGAIGGGVLGGAIGGSSGALIGAALGGAIGYGVGHSMDVEDQRRMAYALEQNRQAQWVNPDGTTYQMQPTGTFYSNEGRECRQFTMLAEVEGRPERMNGTACRQPDGSWDMGT
ncbi:MAG TPA: glycine zipper domain-containing protein [Kofleriaceae bacterium]|jgi:surface antigen|nr:glycine zipper domain-containing protein [Kofleriaceae bacterium]